MWLYLLTEFDCFGCDASIYNLKQPQLCVTEKDRWMKQILTIDVLFKPLTGTCLIMRGQVFLWLEQQNFTKILKSKFAKSGCLCMASNSIHQHFSWKKMESDSFVLMCTSDREIGSSFCVNSMWHWLGNPFQMWQKIECSVSDVTYTC